MKLWLVMRDDGNVCCPAAEVAAVCSSREIAARFISANPEPHCWLDEWDTDEWYSQAPGPAFAPPNKPE